MVDTKTPASRSQNMRQVRSRDTGPELAVRSILHRLGYRFRLQRKNLPGTPDLVLAKWHTAIFVHGCFWHGHTCKRGKLPSNNQSFWEKKIRGNIARDARNRENLIKQGWKVLELWECEIRDREALENRLKMELK